MSNIFTEISVLLVHYLLRNFFSSSAPNYGIMLNYLKSYKDLILPILFLPKLIVDMFFHSVV